MLTAINLTGETPALRIYGGITATMHYTEGGGSPSAKVGRDFTAALLPPLANSSQYETGLLSHSYRSFFVWKRLPANASLTKTPQNSVGV